MGFMEENQQALYDKLYANPFGSFPQDRPPIFSPAAASQNPANSSGLYFNWTPLVLPFEFTDWASESRAHVESCYIGDWSAIGKIVVRGPDALRFMACTGTNDLSRFAVGQIKHHIQLTETGLIASEGIVYRMSEEEIFYSGGGADWTIWQLSLGDWNAQIEDVSARRFIFEVQGPTSLKALEAATGTSLRDIGFNRGRRTSIDGIPVEILRTGISGELGYELHGSADHAAMVWSAVVKAGAPAGIRQLGIRAQLVQHIEAGIATVGIDYLPASIGTPGAQRVFPAGAPSGSFIPRGGLTDFFRFPGELGWSNRAATTVHDFVGRDALLKQAASGGTARTLVTLEWNKEDVEALAVACFKDNGPVPEHMEMPRKVGSSYDSVFVQGTEVGVSTSRTFSSNLRQTISLCVIDRQHSAIGTEVSVLWGSPGSAQREVRAVVVRTPAKPDRRRTDVSII